MQGTQIAFEFHLSFQKLLEHQLIGSSFLMAIAAFELLFYWFSLAFFEMSSLFVFEKKGGLSSGF